MDIFSVLLAWILFLIFRRIEIEYPIMQNLFYPVYNFWTVICLIPVFWLFVFWISGYYNQPFRKSRLSELVQTFVSVLLGSIILFFVLLLDDQVVSYTDYYLSFFVLFLIYFFVVYFCRYALTRVTTHQVHNRILGFNTLIIGTGKNARKIYDQLGRLKKSTGNLICGFVSENKKRISVDKSLILGEMTDLSRIIKENEIEEVIVAIDSEKSDDLFGIINQLYSYNVDIRFTPRLYDFLVGGIRLSTIYGTPLVNVLDNKMPDWQQNVKRFLDIFVSALVLLLSSPLLCYLAIRVKLSSKGSVFYLQERIGLCGKSFSIIKFRTMYENSEGEKPQLSSKDDARITPFGKTLRKYHLDELPQFVNVIKGDMSIVGPRPERKYFIDQIIEKAPYYSLIHKIRPGVTSWGMVKYGYANNVDKMVDRLNYDIIYLENMSLTIDFKILIYTVLTIISGKGI
jgi:exopolysaccharide biosynthesis polyprenyl glycosylphosphotransferase